MIFSYCSFLSLRKFTAMFSANSVNKKARIHINGKLVSLIIGMLFFTAPVQSQHIIDKIMKDPPGFPLHLMPAPEPTGRFLEPGLFAHTKPLFEVFSSLNNAFVGTESGNLYLRLADEETIQVIAKPAIGWHWNMEGARMSPDGKQIAVKQIDDRAVPKILLTLASSADTTYKPYSRAGQPIPKNQFYIVDIPSGKSTTINHNTALPYVHVTGWSNDSKSIRLIQADRLLKKLELLTVAPSSGICTTIFSEKSDTYLVGLNLLQGYSDRLTDMNLAYFLDDKNQFIWTSEQSGFNQLYLYDGKGKLIKPLSNKNKNGIVSQLVEVDEKNNWAYFYASANAAHPYDIQLFRTSLTTDKIEKISDGPVIMETLFSVNKDSIWVWRTKLPDMMQIDLLHSNGQFINTAWKADLKPVETSGLKPEYTQVLAADNKTLLEAMLLKPADFNPASHYPVVEFIYGGPNATVLPRTIFDRSMWNMQNLANKGFIIVFIDGRGTPERGKEFLNFSYGKLGQVEIKDHIAAIKKLGASRPYMDLAKVGVTGHSWGGHFALRAMIEAPDFYKAGHINAAAIDPINFRIAVEPFMGCMPEDCKERYNLSALTDKLNSLKGALSINHGTADDDVPIEEAYKLIDALKKTGFTNYEFKAYQGMDHIIMRDRNWEPDMIDFFIKKLK